MSKNTLHLSDFIQNSQTPWHAISLIEKEFKKEGFLPLDETKTWRLSPGKKYFVSRGGALFAFLLPKNTPEKFLFTLSHTDSPTFKLKPQPEKTLGGEVILGLEIYGGPLLTSWLNRPLGIAGTVILEDGQTVLFNQKDEPVFLAQLAIHLDRKVNDEGVVLKKHDHLFALTGQPAEKSRLLERWAKKCVGKQILAHDLFLYPLDPPSLIGQKNNPWLLAPRLDNLSSVHASLIALKKASVKNSLIGAFFFNHEEIGSETKEGASSFFAEEQLKRIEESLGWKKEQHIIASQNSLALSLDASHGLHPLYPDRYDDNAPLLGKGPVVKTHAGKRYATSAKGVAAIKTLGIPVQIGSSRGDIPCGTTVGPIFETRMGISTVDLGIPILSMHASYEAAALSDQNNLIRLLDRFYAK